MLDVKVLASLVEGHAIKDNGEIDADSEFECPKCFGSYFGASHWNTKEPEYYCHDEYERGCSWHGTKEQCFVHTYDKATLAAELLAAYKKIEELEK